MTPQQKIKWKALIIDSGWTEESLPEITESNINELFDNAECLQDALEELRCNGEPTEIYNKEVRGSRHYEDEEVASKMPDGSWVGWTYWSGGGKHGEPSAMPWLENAYDLIVTEKEVKAIHRTFEKL